jgi:hypothetical protein
MKINIFISYSSQDKNKMGSFKRAIKKRPSLNPIVVADKRSPRKSLSDKVKEAILESDYIVPILTKGSINNQWVNQEIGYAEALGTKIRMFPIIQISILSDLKGFIHKNLELPYQYDSSGGNEVRNFRKCCKLLLDDIVDLEGIKKQEEAEEVKDNLERVNVTNFRPSDFPINKMVTEKTTFNLRIRLSSPAQTFYAYYLIDTDKNESKWIGYTNNNGPDRKINGEYTKYLQNNRTNSYSIDENVTRAVKERFPDLKGELTSIKRVRFRGDRNINEVIRCYYAFSEAN